MEEGFRSMHGIPGVVGAIDGSYIPIDPPQENRRDYWCRKGFYAVLLQAICDSTGYIWDFNCGWCASMHDYRLFCHTPASTRIARGDLHGMALLGDAAYPVRAYMLPPYKAGSTPFEPWQASFNYKQSASRMPIERTFGVLKGRWRILLEKVPGKLELVAPTVATCIVLHNLCQSKGDHFDGAWLTEGPGSAEVAYLQETVAENVERMMHTDQREGDPPRQLVDMDGGLQEAKVARDNLAKALYNRESDSDSDSD
jgi:hypothetical protein